MKEQKWYTLEKHHGLWTIWKHHEGNHSVLVYGIYTSEFKSQCLQYIKDNKIKLGKVRVKCKASS